jgi:hypothetical protein
MAGDGGNQTLEEYGFTKEQIGAFREQFSMWV